MDETLYVAKVGKSVALKGENRLIIDSDFPEQFKKGAVFTTKRGNLTIEQFDSHRSVVKFEGVNTLEDAKKITNLELYTTKEATKANVTLKEGEYFWFDIIGCEVFEATHELGSVKEVQRIANTDYLLIATHSSLVAQKHPKEFLIPYVDAYVKRVNIDEKRIETEGGLDVLYAS